MTILMTISGVLVAVAAALVLFRVVVGPSLHDRLVALDTVAALIVCGIVIRSAHRGEIGDLVLLVLVVLVGGLSTVTAIRLASREEQ
ncbi:hypothetical protein O9K63_11675 [Janibacter cremeus]|uniref:hypothetical protein n=1 Tax=Janibacter cremeus TaxID=1285192 RepID=UPI0023F6B9AF|nr:hypothetical protein [Janibacter cremeus]WEV77248.1 hypothetical protein O9K63_11675 [Janibacter cremeus]